MANGRDIAKAAIGGALGGAILWLAIYPLVKRQIEGSVREQLRTQLPNELASTLDAKLREYSITPQTISNLARLIDMFGRVGAAVPSAALPASSGTAGLGRVPYASVNGQYVRIR